MQMDINCDMGESFGAYTLGRDAEVIAHITSANIACGFHASDPLVMQRTLALCAAHGVGAGAHPGYPDLVGFGRRKMDCAPEEIRAGLIYQVGALAGLARSQGLALQHVKPHGALYNTAAADEATAVAAYDPGLIMVTLAGPGGQVIRGQRGLRRPGLHPRGPAGQPPAPRRGHPRPRGGGGPLSAHGQGGRGGGRGREPGALAPAHHLRARRHPRRIKQTLPAGGVELKPLGRIL